MNKKEAAVVIPIYSEILSQQETIALRQANIIFKEYDIIAIAPINLNVDKSIFNRIERFEEFFF